MPATLPWIVQKFGGTSVGKLLDTITGEIIPSYLSQKYNVAVVCSARSGRDKASGSTSMLLQAASLAESREPSATRTLDGVIDLLISQHLDAARLALGGNGSGELLEELERDIVADCEAVRVFLHAAQTVGELSERSRDRVMSVGEKLSARIVAASLSSKGFDTALVILDDLVSETYSDDIQKQREAYDKLGPEFYNNLSRKLGKILLDNIGKIPVITGFFGMMPYSLIRTVGRGYSDLCAAMCAVGVDAHELQIWKEVDGIFTADPSKVPSARLLATVTPEEAMELTFYGSEVIHPLTMKHLQSANIPLRIKNVKRPEGPGSTIYPSEKTSRGSPTRRLSPDRRAFMDAHGYEGEDDQTLSRRTPTAITSKTEIALINFLPSGTTTNKYEHLSEVLSRLVSLKVIPDLMCTSEQSVSFAVHMEAGAASVDDIASSLGSLGNVTVTEKMSIVSVIGQRMRNMVGIAGEIFTTLAEAGINIYLISQGASEINISFVIKESHVLQAIDVIHSQILNIPSSVEHTGLTGKNGIRGPWLF